MMRYSFKAAVLSGVALTATMPMASAFFPPIPQPPEVITVVPPTTPPVIVPPVPVVPPVVTPPQPPIKDCTCDDPGTPQGVPEPMSIIATLSGLATLAGYGIRKRNKS
jgi:hypothetical protein